MADLSTSYMGLKLRNPIVVASCGLTKSAEGILRCAEAGAGAVVMKSIFEEQFLGETALAEKAASYYPEALDYLRKGGLLEYAPQNMCEIIEKTKKEVDIPVFASINCQSPALWPRFAQQFQEAGADGLELNIYFLPFDLKIPGTEYEKFHIEILQEVKKATSIPVAVKLTSQLTSVPSLVYKLSEAGCDAVVLFNWFLNPDVDIESLQIKNIIGRGDFFQSLRWVALLAGRVDCDIASSGGLRKVEDLIKQILAGAAVGQVCTLFYQKGLQVLKDLLRGLEVWMDAHHHSTIDDFKGELSFKKQEISLKEPIEAEAYFRTQYLKTYSKLE
ncbi:Dihydroorotate dehydrogenase [subsurface metagenome]